MDASLKRLGLDYIDLMIGLSKYYEPDDFDRLVKATSIKPALLQNETHPYHQSEKMKAHIAKYGTVMESWFRRKFSACLPSFRFA